MVSVSGDNVGNVCEASILRAITAYCKLGGGLEFGGCVFSKKGESGPHSYIQIYIALQFHDHSQNKSIAGNLDTSKTGVVCSRLTELARLNVPLCCTCV